MPRSRIDTSEDPRFASLFYSYFILVHKIFQLFQSLATGVHFECNFLSASWQIRPGQHVPPSAIIIYTHGYVVAQNNFPSVLSNTAVHSSYCKVPEPVRRCSGCDTTLRAIIETSNRHFKSTLDG